MARVGDGNRPPLRSFNNLNIPDAHSGQDWRAWFAEHGARLRLIARQWTRCEADADDVLQEAFVRFWKHQRHLPGNPNALVVTSLRRAALDLLRRGDRRAAREKVVGDDMDTVTWFEPEADPQGRRSQQYSADQLSAERPADAVDARNQLNKSTALLRLPLKALP